jgi:hypothetical protein
LFQAGSFLFGVPVALRRNQPTVRQFHLALEPQQGSESNLERRRGFVVFWMHMRALRLLGSVLAVLFVLTTAPSMPGEDLKNCAASETRQARREASHLGDWEELYRSFKRFQSCDRGKLTEEYSYAISRLLAHRWEQVDVLLGLAAGDQDFKRFVLRHIDENIPEEEAQVIISNSRERCPSEGKWLCQAIVDY